MPFEWLPEETEECDHDCDNCPIRFRNWCPGAEDHPYDGGGFEEE